MSIPSCPACNDRKWIHSESGKQIPCNCEHQALSMKFINETFPRPMGWLQPPSIPPAPTADDTEQIDDQVQDLLTTMLRTMALEFFGEYVDPEHAGVRDLSCKFRKDLASLGIRLTYDTTIGGGK